MNIQASVPVTGKDFIGRDEEIKKILQLVRLGQSVLIIAPRRFGKTSLLLEILRRIKSKEIYTSYIDLLAAPTLELLSTQVVESTLKNQRLDKAFIRSRHNGLQMMKHPKLNKIIKDFDFLLGFPERQKNEQDLLKQSLSFLDGFTNRQKRRMICALDEFGDVSRVNEGSTARLFRSAVQAQKNVTYLFSGRYESVMNGLFTSKNAPFFRFARIFHLRHIERNKFKKYLMGALSEFKIKAGGNYIESVLDFTEGHPYYTRLALKEVVMYFLLNRKLIDIQDLHKQMLEVENDYLEKSWEDITYNKERTKTLLAIVKSSSGVYSSLSREGINIYRGLNGLIRQGIIYSTPVKTFQLNDPLFKCWIQKNILRDYS